MSLASDYYCSGIDFDPARNYPCFEFFSESAAVESQRKIAQIILFSLTRRAVLSCSSCTRFLQYRAYQILRGRVVGVGDRWFSLWLAQGVKEVEDR